jgi:ATP-dependent DNA helicase DinG
MDIQALYSKTVSGNKFKTRPTQYQMVEFINNCFDNLTDEENRTFLGEHVCIVEAPTGTGKSLAYILAGLTSAIKSEKKFVISTATKTLQAQLVSQDLPFLAEKSGLSFKYGLAKGRSNYLCPYQISNNMITADQDLLQQSEGTRDKLYKILTNFESGKWDGDLDTSPTSIESKLKPLCTADKYQCLGSSCEYNQKDNCQCPYYINREKLKQCDVIVTNHSLLLADINSGGGAVLPCAPKDYLLCVDEAHNLSSYAVSSFMGSFELRASVTNVHALVKLIQSPQNGGYLIDDINLCDKAILQSDELGDALQSFFELLKINDNAFHDDTLILNDYINSLINTEIKDIFIRISLSSAELFDCLEKIQTKLKDATKTSGIVNDNNITKLAFYLSCVESIKQTAEYLTNNDSSRFNANVRFVERKIINNNLEYIILAGVTHVGNHLKNKLWDKVYGACLTSATLAIGESFEYLKLQLGLNLFNSVQQSKLPSLFDYTKQAQLVIPQFKSAPDFATRDMFQRELNAYLGAILNYEQNYGTLVLFFNRQQLIDTFTKLPLKLQNKILLQTEYSSNQKLVEDHKKAIDNGKPSIIFGLNSFAEGVDLPNKYCMHVVITKLPFDTHKDPQNLVREYWIKAENSNFFMDVSLPETCIKLIQAVGRLVRSEEDYGQITICDNRIILKQYGKLLLNSLPNFSRQYNPNFILEHLPKYEA